MVEYKSAQVAGLVGETGATSAQVLAAACGTGTGGLGTVDEGCGTGVGGVAHGLYAVRHDRSESRVDVGVSMLAIVLFNITVLVIEGLSETRDRLVQHIQRLVPAISITERCVF